MKKFKVKIKDKGTFHIETDEAPIVELDSEIGGAYIRFNRGSIDHTEVIADDCEIVTVDVDASHNIIGIELVGIEEFTVQNLIKHIPFEETVVNFDTFLQGARYMPRSVDISQGSDEEQVITM